MSDAPQIHTIRVGSDENISVDCSPVLDTSELMTGIPTVEEVSTSDLTITDVSINTQTMTINSSTVIAGKAIQFSVADVPVSALGETKKIRLTFTTDSTPVRTPVKIIELYIASADGE